MSARLTGLWVMAGIIAGCGWRVYDWKKWEKQTLQKSEITLESKLLSPIDMGLYDCRLEIKGIKVYVPLAICKTSKLTSSSAGDRITLEVKKDDEGRFKATKLKVDFMQPVPGLSLYWWQKQISKLRQQSLLVIKRSSPEPESGLIAGIVLGEKGMLAKDFADALIKTGTMHVVAASGYNVAVIVAMAIKGLTTICSRRKAAALATIMIWFYVMMAGADPPVVRAGVMASLVLISQVTGRDYWVAIGFGASIVSMLIVSPWLIQSVSFQLSIAATAGVIWIAKGLEEWVKPWTNKLGNNAVVVSIVQNGITTVAAVGATAPISLLVFGEVSWLGLGVNPLVLSFIPVLMYLGLAEVIMGLVWFPISIPISWLIMPIAHLWSAIILFAARLPGGTITQSINWWGAIGWWLCLLGFALIGIRRNKYQ